MGIAMSTIIVQGLHAGDANRNLGEALPPRAPESISDDYRDRKFQSLLEFAMQLAGRAIWVLRKKKCVAAAVDVGNIHAAIGADQAMLSFGDQDATLAAHHSLAFCKSDFGYPGIEIVTPRPRP